MNTPVYEYHSGKLFKLLYKPVPLTFETQMPVLVRLIQDESPMGRFNKSTQSTNLSDNYVVTDICGGTGAIELLIGGYGLHYSRHEVIGTLVEEGSSDWAAHQMMNGNMVYHEGDNLYRYIEDGKVVIDTYMPVCTLLTLENWLKITYASGWKLYEPKPEPIFAIGDKVTDGVIDGTIVHIEDAIADVCPSTDKYRIELCNLNHIPESPKQDDIEMPLRKLKPEEVIIDIRLSGTIGSSGNEASFDLELPNGNWITIDYADIPDKQAAKIKSIVEAQEGKC